MVSLVNACPLDNGLLTVPYQFPHLTPWLTLSLLSVERSGGFLVASHCVWNKHPLFCTGSPCDLAFRLLSHDLVCLGPSTLRSLFQVRSHPRAVPRLGLHVWTDLGTFIPCRVELLYISFLLNKYLLKLMTEFL